MQENNDQVNITNELNNIIIKILLPITKNLLDKTKELKEKKFEFRKELNEMKFRKQALIQKRKRLMKQKAIHEKNLNGDLSNTKVCEELLINYINFVDKKESDFIKSKEDFYELKLRKKQLEFNQELINIIKEKSNYDKTKKMKKKNSYEFIKRLDKSTYSISNMKNPYRSFSIEKPKNSKSLTKAITTITPSKIELDEFNKKSKGKISHQRNKSFDNDKTISKNKNNISKEIETLINNYSSKKNIEQSYNSESLENYDEGLSQLKEINKETKEIEKEMKEMMNSILTDENE